MVLIIDAIAIVGSAHLGLLMSTGSCRSQVLSIIELPRPTSLQRMQKHIQCK